MIGIWDGRFYRSGARSGDVCDVLDLALEDLTMPMCPDEIKALRGSDMLELVKDRLLEGALAWADMVERSELPRRTWDWSRHDAMLAAAAVIEVVIVAGKKQVSGKGKPDTLVESSVNAVRKILLDESARHERNEMEDVR